MPRPRPYLYKFISVCCLLVLVSCKSTSTYITEPFSFEKIAKKPNYQNEDSWAVLPSKYTQKLKELTASSIKELEADVFYVYPTLITDKKDIRWNISTNDSLQNV